MATFRGSGDSFAVGSAPPQVQWTVVSGDTAAFRAYVTDEETNPVNIGDWNINMDIIRPSKNAVIVALQPLPDVADGPGEFTVSLTATQSALLQTNDIFDIQMDKKDGTAVWTIAKGSMVVIEDVTR